MGSALLRRVVEKGILSFGSRIGCCGSGARRNINIGFNYPEPMLMTPPFFDEEGRMENKFHNIVKPNYDKQSSGGGVAGGVRMYEKLDSGVARDETEHVEVVGMSFGWLALYNGMSHAMHILNPITGRRIDLPSLPDPQLGRVSRAILSEPPRHNEWGWLGCEAVVAIVFGGGRRLAICEAGVSCEWTAMADDGEIPDEREYEDVIIPDREPYLYCLTRNPTHLVVWDLCNPTNPTLWWVAKWPEFDCESFCWPLRSREDLELKRRCWRTKYIVGDSESGDKFYMVVRHILPPTLGRPYKTFDFDVYGFERRVALRYMKCSLNDQVMFIGTNQSCSFPPIIGSTLGLNSNSIYFTDDCHNMRRPALGRGRGHDNGIFNYQNYTFTTCCGSCPLDNTEKVEEKEKKVIHPAPLWFMYYESMREV